MGVHYGSGGAIYGTGGDVDCPERIGRGMVMVMVKIALMVVVVVNVVLMMVCCGSMLLLTAVVRAA